MYFNINYSRRRGKTHVKIDAASKVKERKKNNNNKKKPEYFFKRKKPEYLIHNIMNEN